MTKVYISQDNVQVCLCCNRKKDTRMGFCFDCAQAESIINDGTDMFDVPIERENQLKSSSAEMNKVKFLIQKGWKPPERKLNSTTGLKRKLRGGA